MQDLKTDTKSRTNLTALWLFVGIIAVAWSVAHLQKVAAEQAWATIVGHGALWLLGIAVLCFGASRIANRKRAGTRAEEHTSEQSVMLQNVLNSLTHPFYVIDAKDYTVTMANPAAQANGSATPIRCHELTHGRDTPCDTDDHICPLEIVKRTKRATIIEHSHRGSNGTTREVEVHAYPILDEDQNVVQMIEYCVDVTERRKTQHKLREAYDRLKISEGELQAAYNQLSASEEELRESQRTLSTLMRNLPGMAYRRHDDQAWTMEFASEGSLELIGHTPEALVAERSVSYGDLIHPEDRVVVDETIQTALEAGESYHIIYRIIAATGENKWVWEQGQTVARDAAGMAVLEGFITDITERKRAEEETRNMEAQLQHSQKLESIGVLAGGIAHDFNNVLAAILGFASLGLVHVNDKDRTRRNLERVVQSANRAKELVAQILTFSRYNEEEKRPLFVHHVVKEALSLLVATLPKSIEIRRNIDTVSDQVLANSTQLHQVLMNLCTNAAHAIGDELGILEVTLGAVEVDGGLASRHTDLAVGSYVELAVRDTGCGMSTEIIDRIFEPFFTTKSTGEGTGMGLSVVHGIVRGHGGALTVESEPGVGSIFRVYLPRITVKSDGPDNPIEIDIPPQGNNERILYVDDEEDLVNAGREWLEEFGYRVTAITSSTDALALFLQDSSEFDLVITDYAMPKMNGEELAAAISKMRPDTPIILATGYSEGISPERLRKSGIRGYFTKPMSIRRVNKLIRAVLDEAPGADRQIHIEDGALS